MIPSESVKKGEDVQNEMVFVVVETVGPVMKILSSAVQKEASAFLYICQIS